MIKLGDNVWYTRWDDTRSYFGVVARELELGYVVELTDGRFIVAQDFELDAEKDQGKDD